VLHPLLTVPRRPLQSSSIWRFRVLVHSTTNSEMQTRMCFDDVAWERSEAIQDVWVHELFKEETLMALGCNCLVPCRPMFSVHWRSMVPGYSPLAGEACPISFSVGGPRLPFAKYTVGHIRLTHISCYGKSPCIRYRNQGRLRPAPTQLYYLLPDEASQHRRASHRIS
jgi:hypothetical protein